MAKGTVKDYPVVSIVGRPNVGKSTLFNKLIKERKAIVDDTPGVTRDKLYGEIKWNGKTLIVVDTGGLVIDGKDEITSGVKKQVYSALEESDFIIFMVDGKDGITAQDESIARVLRKLKNKKTIFLAVNKIDNYKQIPNVYDFYSLGFGDPYPISAISGSSELADIFDVISSSSKESLGEKEEVIKIAIIGKPNVGKSSILNCLLKEERALVTPIPGTTRDSLDSRLCKNGKDFILIDTAGLRRKSKISSNIERYSTIRAISSIEKADVVLLVLDANEPVSDQDQKVASVIKNRFKPSIIIANKWDMLSDKSSIVLNSLKEHILSSLHFIDYSIVLNTSALTKKNIDRILDLAMLAYENCSMRIPTSELNKAVEEIILMTNPPTGKSGKQLKIYYVTQSNIKPPEIVFFVNDSKIIKPQYERFLEKKLRERFDFTGSPIKLVFRNKKKS